MMPSVHQIACMGQPLPAAPLPPSDMTPARLAEQSALRASIAAKAAAPAIRRRLGWLRWNLLAPVWHVVTSPDVLAELARLGIELAIKEAAPEVAPILDASVPLTARLVSDPAILQRVADLQSLLHTTEFSEAARLAFEAIEQAAAADPSLSIPPDAPTRGAIHVE